MCEEERITIFLIIDVKSQSQNQISFMSHGWKERNHFYSSTNLVYYHTMYKG